MSNKISDKDMLAKIKEKRRLLENMLNKKNIDLKNKKVLEMSRELDVLIAEYICILKR